MVEYNTYTITQAGSGQLVTQSLASKAVRFDFRIAGGRGGSCPINAGGFVAATYGTYSFGENETRSIIAYPGEEGDDGGDSDNAASGGTSFFANAGAGADPDGGGGGSMSVLANATAIMIAVSGGSGGGGVDFLNRDEDSGGGGGGSPGGSGGKPAIGDVGGNAETTSLTFAQNTGGNGGGEVSGLGAPSQGAFNPDVALSNTSTDRTISSLGEITVTTHAPPDPVNSLTTSLNANFQPVLSWTPTNNGVTQRIYRKQQSQTSFSEVGSTGSSNGTFTDTSAPVSAIVEYKIVQNDEFFQEGNVSTIQVPDKRVRVYQNGEWKPTFEDLQVYQNGQWVKTTLDIL